MPYEFPAESLREKLSQGHCPNCQNTPKSFTIEAGVLWIQTFPTENIFEEQKGKIMASRVCNDCGFVSFFDPTILGLKFPLTT